MEWLQNNCKKINVRINSGGGSVLDGYAIVSSILNSKVPCCTYIDGLAASMAAVIAVSGKKCYMVDYGTFMIHNAIDTAGTSEKKIVELFNDSIKTIISNRCGKSMDEVGKMMEKETWMNAKECLENGFIDEIVSTEKPINIKVNASIDERFAIYNEILTKPTNNMKQIQASLKLAENATEVDMVNAISAKDAEIAKLKLENEAFKAEKIANENAAKEALKVKATELAEKAEKDGKIKADEKAALIANASSSIENFSLVEKMIEKITNVKPAEKIFNSENAKIDAERAAWSWTDWSKKDSKGLLKMKNESPALYEQLYNKEFKK